MKDGYGRTYSLANAASTAVMTIIRPQGRTERLNMISCSALPTSDHESSFATSRRTASFPVQGAKTFRNVVPIG